MTLFRSLFLFLVFSFAFNLSAEAKQPMKMKYVNPAAAFVGTWRVDSYDTRDFDKLPNDLQDQLKEEAGAFPIGQRLKMDAPGPTVMPGSIDPSTMKSDVVGEEVDITLLSPFVPEVCQLDAWGSACNFPNSEYRSEFMITDIHKWDNPEKRGVLWPDIKPVTFSFVRLEPVGPRSFDAWVAKNGDVVISIILYVPKKGGDSVGTLGIRLKRVKE